MGFWDALKGLLPTETEIAIHRFDRFAATAPEHGSLSDEDAAAYDAKYDALLDRAVNLIEREEQAGK